MTNIRNGFSVNPGFIEVTENRMTQIPKWSAIIQWIDASVEMKVFSLRTNFNAQYFLIRLSFNIKQKYMGKVFKALTWSDYISSFCLHKCADIIKRSIFFFTRLISFWRRLRGQLSSAWRCLSFQDRHSSHSKCQ